MYVVAGVTGNTGSAVAETLLSRGKPLRAIVREESKAEAWKKKGAEAVVASLSDSATLARALSGAAGAYLLNPPQYAAEDLIAAQGAVSDSIAEAVQASGIPHVVLLSSHGAQHAKGTGPIRSLHYMEQAIGNAAKSLTILRAAFFLENWIPVLGEVKANGVLPSFLTPGRAIPMVATRDIGRVAAEALLDPPQGTRLIELSGPRDWTPEDIARVLAEALGREVTVRGLPLEAVVPAFTAAGMSIGSAKLLEEMYAAINGGRVAPEGGGAIARRGTLGPEDVLAPLLKSAAA